MAEAIVLVGAHHTSQQADLTRTLTLRRGIGLLRRRLFVIVIVIVIIVAVRSVVVVVVVLFIVVIVTVRVYGVTTTRTSTGRAQSATATRRATATATAAIVTGAFPPVAGGSQLACRPVNHGQPQRHHRHGETQKQLGHGQQPQHQTKTHPQKTCQKRPKMLPRTEEVAARSSRGKTRAKKEDQQQQNEQKTERKSRPFLCVGLKKRRREKPRYLR